MWLDIFDNQWIKHAYMLCFIFLPDGVHHNSRPAPLFLAGCLLHHAGGGHRAPHVYRLPLPRQATSGDGHAVAGWLA